MIKHLLMVGIGGFIGAIGRYLVDQLIARDTGFPWHTFTVNIIGSLLLGFFLGYFTKHIDVSESMRLLLTVGFCGSFTTFSTFAVQNYQLIQEKPFTALIYTVASFTIGLTAAWAGLWLAK